MKAVRRQTFNLRFLLFVHFPFFLFYFLQKLNQYRKEGRLALKHMWIVIAVRISVEDCA